MFSYEPFPEAQAAGALVAMTSNFILNNFLTYRDQRLKGFALLRGLLLFYLVCSVGLIANVGVAFSVYDQEPIWWLAGAAGALMGRGVELRDVRTVRLAQAMNSPNLESTGLESTSLKSAGLESSDLGPAMSPNDRRLVRNTGSHDIGGGSVAARRRGLDAADLRRSYYWMWSKHLAGGYYDHPPMVAVVIRLGTMIAGDTELGVRLVSILLALPMSWRCIAPRRSCSAACAWPRPRPFSSTSP